MFEHVLACVDGSEQAHKAALLAGDLAERYGAKLTLLCVWSEAADLAQSFANEVVDREAKSLNGRHNVRLSRVVEFGDAARVIVDRAQNDGVDLIVIGSRGRSGVMSLVLGSVSQSVVSHATCTCVVVR